MFETQQVGEWLPGRIERWRPFLVALAVTPFVFVLGIGDIGPEGPNLFIGYLLFPYAAAMFFGTAILDNVAGFFVSWLLALLQMPIYGLIFSLSKSRSFAWKVILVVHTCGIVLSVVVFAILLLFLKAQYQS
jgi:hypothetical protein